MLLQLRTGDTLFVYEMNDDTRMKIAELNYHFNLKSWDLETKGFEKTFSSTGSHNLLIHFSTDHQFVRYVFNATIHYIPNNTTCAHIFDKTELKLTNAMGCTEWIITAPFVISTINIKFQYFEVYIKARLGHFFIVQHGFQAVGVISTAHSGSSRWLMS